MKFVIKFNPMRICPKKRHTLISKETCLFGAVSKLYKRHGVALFQSNQCRLNERDERKLN